MAGGARAARQARIATVEHLRHAPIARTWHLGKLWEAFQLHTENLGSRHAATLMLFGGLGYRPPYPTSWPAAAELIVADEARYLAKADLYILTPQMCDVVVAAAHTVTVDDLQLLDADDLPSPTGVLVLLHPIITSTVVGDPADLRAFTCGVRVSSWGRWRPARRGVRPAWVRRAGAWAASPRPAGRTPAAPTPPAALSGRPCACARSRPG